MLGCATGLTPTASLASRKRSPATSDAPPPLAAARGPLPAFDRPVPPLAPSVTEPVASRPRGGSSPSSVATDEDEEDNDDEEDRNSELPVPADGAAPQPEDEREQDDDEEEVDDAEPAQRRPGPLFRGRPAAAAPWWTLAPRGRGVPLAFRGTAQRLGSGQEVGAGPAPQREADVRTLRAAALSRTVAATQNAAAAPTLVSAPSTSPDLQARERSRYRACGPTRRVIPLLPPKAHRMKVAHRC